MMAEPTQADYSIANNLCDTDNWDKHVQEIAQTLADEREPLHKALDSVYRTLNAHNRPDFPLPNEERLRLREICAKALWPREEDEPTGS
jgi:hypothetical protein